MTLIDCKPDDSQLSTPTMEGKPWQLRAKRIGLSQKLLAQLTGQTENTVSRQLGEKFDGGVPKHVRAIIWAWEQFPQKDRDAMVSAAGRDYEE